MFCLVMEQCACVSWILLNWFFQFQLYVPSGYDKEAKNNCIEGPGSAIIK